MNFLLKHHLGATLVATILLTPPVYAAEWFVSPTGDDASAGTLEAPFATLTRARDEARKHVGETRTISLRGGLHFLPQGFALESEDSGTAESPVVWRAYEGEKPVLVGGRQIANWEPAENGVWKADVGAQGFKDVAFHQLMFNGVRQHLARFPNFDPTNPYGGSWAYAGGETWPMYAEKDGEDKHTLAVKPADWRKWARPEEAEVFIFPRFNWWNNILPVKSVDEATHTISTAKDASFAMRANDRYFIQGVREELDAPGEWYLDRKTATLFFIPPAPLTGGAVLAPTTRDIVTFDAAAYVTLRGLTLECADGSAVVMKNSKGCRIVACTIRNVGDYNGSGVSINGGTDNGIVGCDIHDTGSHAVFMTGGDRKTLTPAGNFVDNCYIHHPGVFYKQGCGVAIEGVGQRVSHCLIHDTPRFGLLFGGNNQTLELNHLRHLALETEDVGATYCGGRDWISPRGSVLRNNFIHDVLGYGWNGKWTSPYFAWGIYLDDNSAGVDVIGNIVARCGRSLIHGHSARDCRVENNVFVEGGQRQWEFNGWTTAMHFWSAHFDSMVKGYESVVNEPAWRDMRGMKLHPKDAPDADGRVMSGNVFAKNIIDWKAPDARALNVVAFDPTRNEFDHNLYWHHGQPLKTGQRKAGREIGGNLAPNPGFEAGELGSMPKDWTWQVFTPTSKAALVEDGDRKCLRIEAAFNPAKQRDNYPIVAGREFALKPGGTYRLRARLRTDREGAACGLLVQCWIPPKDGAAAHFWSSSPSDVKLTREWKQAEFIFAIPAQGEKGWHEKMANNFRVRVDWKEETGALFVDDVELTELEPLDEWKSWEALGGDQHSVVADPRFLNAEKDDYRLASDSPAWALGFKPIPVDQIGPYASPDRATWPIVEAEGAREKPLR